MEEYQKYIMHDMTLERRFQPILVNEPNAAETLEMLKGLKVRYEAHHQVTYSDESLKAAVTLSDTHLADRHFPDKAIDLIDEAGAMVRLASIKRAPEDHTTVPVVSAQDINTIIKQLTDDLVAFGGDSHQKNVQA
jgi:ATP-dependent Clp protease ATP-binding subunit ClpC